VTFNKAYIPCFLELNPGKSKVAAGLGRGWLSTFGWGHPGRRLRRSDPGPRWPFQAPAERCSRRTPASGGVRVPRRAACCVRARPSRRGEVEAIRPQDAGDRDRRHGKWQERHRTLLLGALSREGREVMHATGSKSFTATFAHGGGATHPEFRRCACTSTSHQCLEERPRLPGPGRGAPDPSTSAKSLPSASLRARRSQVDKLIDAARGRCQAVVATGERPRSSRWKDSRGVR
jgi:hypothetical protein